MAMFVDVAKIYVKGGDGGRGSNSMRREKFVPEGGPWGGDGGRGGHVIFMVDLGLNTLIDFRYNRHFRAPRGEHGMSKGMNGASGEDLVVKVPPGTVVKDADTGELLADMTEAGLQVIVARGGRSGRGNMKFATPQNKAPTFYEKGEPGEERWLVLELKVIADVGLVGFPNAGKSTLLSRVSAARPKVANYPFTTLSPHLGVVDVGDGRSFVMADIPGLIEGAHQGVGLGHEFLRHVERTKVLVHVLDGGGTEGRDPLEDFEVIGRELELYNPRLMRRLSLVAFNKMDLPDAAENLVRIRPRLEELGYRVFPISGATGEGIRPLLQATADAIAGYLPESEAEPEAEALYRAEERNRYEITRNDRGDWVVSGRELERLVAMTMWENEEAVARFARIFRAMGIENELYRRGAQHGDTIRIADIEFELTPELGEG
jgi:GTPase